MRDSRTFPHFRTPDFGFHLAIISMESFGKVVRTPDERFASVKGWPYAPRYLEDLDTFVGLRLHYIDEGSRDVNAESTA